MRAVTGVRNRWVTTEIKKLQAYRGITIHADFGLHDQMMYLVERNLDRGSRVVDVGAGAGAFTRRLVDRGYEVTPIDTDVENWQIEDIALRTDDLNAGIDQALVGVFDAAVAMEVIEHVENPWQFMRDMGSLLRPGGLLFLSTPNVASFLSRARFLVKGRFHQFDEEDLVYGHINPMTPFEIETISAREGWSVVESGPGGYLPVFDLSGHGLGLVPRNLLRGLAYVIARGPKHGWCSLYVLRRS
jgi:SAM-dependent methyltransferase